MGIAKLAKVTLILPRVESAQAISRLAEFQWFHPVPTSSEHSEPNLDNLLLRSQKLYQNVDEIVRSLGIKVGIGIIDTMIKGAKKEKKEFKVTELESLIAKLEAESKILVEESRAILNEQALLKRQLEEFNTLKDALRVVSGLQVNLNMIGEGRRFYSAMYIINIKDFPEIQRSLPGISLITIPLNDFQSSLFTVGAKDEAERINKVIRSFDANPFIIPSNLPQNPKSAYDYVLAKMSELTKKKKEIDSQITNITTDITPKILSIHEGAKVSRDVLETLRKPGGLRKFAIIQGYIPNIMAKKFRRVTNKWVTIVEDVPESSSLHYEVHNGKKQDDSQPKPSLFVNGRYFRSFEPITLTQGLPKPSELDPTPMIAFIFPILYGLMFGDLGQGAIIAGVGAVFRLRGVGNLRQWGTLLLASGISAMIVGLMVGEIFGFHLQQLPGGEVLKSTGFIGILNATEFTQENVLTILTISINIGILHLISAFSLSIYKGIMDGKRFEVVTQRVPVLIMYMSIISIMLAAVGANYQVLEMFSSQNPAPFFSNIAGDWVTVEITAKIAFPILLGSMVIQIIAIPLGAKLGKIHVHGSIGEELFMTVIEVMLIRLVELFANTISYTRIGIMLLVHVALMSTTNGGVEFFMSEGNLGVAIGLLFLGNIGVMMMEGLLVYIQALRLHLYEWFTKFYEGSGISFRKIVPEMLYTSIIWEPTIDKKGSKM
ncbi:MAG TPA: V-type ATPase 116kDa subunit family protein [Nitrososphaeraceae archaeon]|nr:V-type ATPase 116kDa subunit family protein [Nitrososphaeraceae archaeon]